MRRYQFRDQLIDTGGRLVVRNVRDVVIDHSGVATGFISLRNRKRVVRKQFAGIVTPRDPGAWTLQPVYRLEPPDQWSDGDVPSDDEFYAWLDSLDAEEVE